MSIDALPPKHSSAAPKPPPQVNLERVVPTFESGSIRCEVERARQQRVIEDVDLVKRLQEANGERDEACARLRVQLLQDAYRVDPLITPRLAKLAGMLQRILRLAAPLDVFVKASETRNASCFPSRKGTRLVMALHSSLISALTTQELLFVMGHEIGHAVLNHTELPRVDFENPYFSPLEVMQLHSLDRAREVSCDRFGLLACQNVRVASSALFKIASGLDEKWISFDESAYARHFDDFASMAEVVELANVSRTHPQMPLRVKALIAFSKSETMALAFGKSKWSISASELERSVETMLSVLDPDLSELVSAEEKKAFGNFLFFGALHVMAADGRIQPRERAWLRNSFSGDHSDAEIDGYVRQPEKRREILEGPAHVLRGKLSEMKRTAILRPLCEVALAADGMDTEEIEAIQQLCALLHIRTDLARHVFQQQLEEIEANDDDKVQDDLSVADAEVPSVSNRQRQEAGGDGDLLGIIVGRTTLSAAARQEVEPLCDRLRKASLTMALAIRSLVAWAIHESRADGRLTKAEGKRLAIAAIKSCRESKAEDGKPRRSAKSSDVLVAKYGVVALFRRGEPVTGAPDSTKYTVQTVSRSRGTLGVAQPSTPENVIEADAREFLKDIQGGAWPEEL